MSKRYEIGSFYEKEKLVEDIDIKKDCFYDKIIQKDKYCFFESGRSAISAVIEDIEKQTNNKVCLIPSYICDTVVKPFVIKGWKVYFYQLNDKLEPIESEVIDLVKKYDPSVIFTVLYYGNDSIINIRGFLKEWEDNKEHFCVEDLTQSIFYFEKLEMGFVDKMKYQVASLRKWLPIPDGGVANLYNEPKYIEKEKPEYESYQLLAQSMKAEYLKGENISKDKFLKLHRIAEDALDDRYEILPMNNESIKVLKNIDWEKIYTRRNENAIYLQEELELFSEIDNFWKLDKNAAPLYMPIIIEDRDAFQEYMKRQNIFLPVLWPVPEQVGDALNEFVDRIYNKMLAIPCDHRYTKKDMKYIIDKIRIYFENI